MKLLLWLGLLTKRLYKKPAFVVLLLLIPALVLLYSAAAREDSGMLTVALAREGQDALAEQVMDSFDSSSQLIRYVRCDSAGEAEDLVRYGKADMAWIFPEEMQARLEAFVESPTEKKALVTVLVRSDDVSLMLAREKLSGELYRHISALLYVDYVRAQVPGLSHLSVEELMDYYNSRDITAELFSFDETDPATASVRTVHYLTAPLRGLLAVLAVLCGMATAMYFVADCRRGTFGWVRARALPAVELGCQLVSLVNVMSVVLAALALAGQAGPILRELGAAALYCLCAAAFCMMLRRLCRSVRALGVLLPLLVVGMLLICPVFFDLGAMRSLQYLLPPTYYINGVYNTKYLWYMVLYTAGCFGVYTLLGFVKNRRHHGSI